MSEMIYSERFTPRLSPVDLHHVTDEWEFYPSQSGHAWINIGHIVSVHLPRRREDRQQFVESMRSVLGKVEAFLTAEAEKEWEEYFGGEK